MRVLVIGGGGFVGAKLAQRLAAEGALRGQPITALVQADIVAPVPVTGSGGIALDVADAAQTAALIGQGWDVIYHLAAIVSGQAEAEFDLGMRINLHGTLNVLEGARALGTAPVVVFASSVAVYGGAAPDPIDDFTVLQPQTSYGAQKAAAELMIADYSRKGFVRGRGLRLPTVTIRPGKPNAAASSFMSSIFREPLQGESANCPVGEDYAVWHCSARTVVRNLIHAAGIDQAALGTAPCLILPGRVDTIGEMIAAMTRVAGPEAAARITRNREPVIEKIVTGWRQRLDCARGLSLGFIADASFEDNVRYFLEDDIRR